MQNLFLRLTALSLLATVAACGGDGGGTDIDAGTDTSDTDGGSTDTTDDGSGAGDATDDGSGAGDTTDDTTGDTSTDTTDTVDDTTDTTTDGSGATDTIDDTSDVAVTCGNGTVDDGEQCDGTNLNDFDCAGVGFATGTLACADDCTFDTSACSSGPGCGDGITQADEECDDDNTSDGDGCSSLCDLCADDASEPNYDIEHATALPYGVDSANLVAQSGNEDWYLIDVAPGCRATFEIITTDPSLLEANIIDVDGTILGTSEVTATGIRVDYFVDDGGFSAGTFVVRVRPVSAASCVGYTFSSAPICG